MRSSRYIRKCKINKNYRNIQFKTIFLHPLTLFDVPMCVIRPALQSADSISLWPAWICAAG